MLVTRNIWEALAREHPVTSRDERPDMICIGHVQIMEVTYWDWRPQISDSRVLVSRSEEIDGVPFVRLEYLLGCKMLMPGDKHARDVRMIEEHLRDQE